MNIDERIQHAEKLNRALKRDLETHDARVTKYLRLLALQQDNKVLQRRLIGALGVATSMANGVVP